MERQIGATVRYLTNRDLRGAIPHNWSIEVSQGFYTPICGNQVTLQTVRSAHHACMLISQYLALPDMAERSTMAVEPILVQRELF
jgi:hypothetical protein